jgi:hypothetical protein
MPLFDDYVPFNYETPELFGDDWFGGDDWSLPVGSETGADIESLYDYADDESFNWFDDFLAGTGDDWYADVPSETGGDFTMDDLNYGGGNWLDDFISDSIYTPQEDYSDYSWIDDLLAEAEGDSETSGEDAGGPFGWGILPGLRDTLFGSGEGPLGGNVLGGGGILGAILGLGGQGGGGILGGGGEGGEGGGGGLGSLMGGNPLLSFLAMKSLLKDEPSAEGTVPIGGEAYGGPAFNYQDYQPTNLTPALMPGVGYANMGPPSPPPPEVPGMMHGGDVRPGDITFAKLEPGEFVIQKPAVDAVGIETLEQINNMGNGGSYYG